jgi:glycosyltransferase involved in cell wall biosynthesis
MRTVNRNLNGAENPKAMTVLPNGAGARKLAFVISSLGSGGAERVCATLANHWAAAGWTISVITLSGADTDFYKLDDRVERIGLCRTGVSTNSLSATTNNWQRARDLRRVLQSGRPDVALSLIDQNNVLLALASLGQSVPVCIGAEHIHPPQAPLGIFWSVLRRLTYKNLWAVVALTSDSAEWIRRNTRAVRVPVIPNAVPWPVPTTEPNVPPPPKYGGRLLAAGRLHPQKGFDLLLPCFGKLARQYSDWDLAIVGEGHERGRLQAMIGQLGLENRVHLPGRVGNIGDWYHNADIFVMPSRFEGFPMTLVEAMAHGKPSVSFDCDTGPRDIIRHGVDGILVPSGDTERLGIELQRLMDNTDERSRLGTHAREIHTRFSIDRVAGMWESLFDDALGSSRVRR